MSAQKAMAMLKVEHPYLFLKDRVLSPYDICMALLSEELTEYDLTN
jgi:hypothetical protein